MMKRRKKQGVKVTMEVVEDGVWGAEVEDDGGPDGGACVRRDKETKGKKKKKRQGEMQNKKAQKKERRSRGRSRR